MAETEAPAKKRWCAWCAANHLVTAFNEGQRYCRQAATEYGRVRRGSAKEDAVGPIAYRNPKAGQE